MLPGGINLKLDEMNYRLKKEKLARLLLEKKKRLADRSFYYFSKYVLGNRDMQIQPHWFICQFVQENAGIHPPATVDDLLILVPRGTFKSTVVTVGLPLWLLTKNPDLRFLLDSIKMANTRGWLGLITKHIEQNEEFRRLYGDLSPASRHDTWTKEQISIAGRRRYVAENSITAGSIETPKVSQHYDMYIGDDLQTKENITSKEAIDGVENHVQLVLPLLDPQESLAGRRRPRIFIGTRWHFDDYYGRMLARLKEAKRRKVPMGLKVFAYGCVEKARMVDGRFVLEGKEFFPARFPVKYLNELQESGGMSSYEFSCNYLNDPLPEGAAVFRLSRFCWFNDRQRRIGNRILDMPKILYHFTTVDPSLGESADSDYSAIVTVGVDAEWNLYILEVLREHWQPEELLDGLFDVHRRLRPFRMAIESVSWQRTLVYGFEKKARESADWFHIDQLKTDNQISKEMRIRGFEPFLTSQKVFFRVDDKIPLTSDVDVLYINLVPAQDVLADEMVRFPLGATKDCVDALAYMPQILFPAGVTPPPVPVKEGTFAAVVEQIKARRHARTSQLRIR